MDFPHSNFESIDACAAWSCSGSADLLAVCVHFYVAVCVVFRIFFFPNFHLLVCAFYDASFLLLAVDTSYAFVFTLFCYQIDYAIDRWMLRNGMGRG